MGIEGISRVKSYLTNKIRDKEYVANVNTLGLQNITKVPKSPDYLKGVINLRDLVLSVIETYLIYG